MSKGHCLISLTTMVRIHFQISFKSSYISFFINSYTAHTSEFEEISKMFSERCCYCTQHLCAVTTFSTTTKKLHLAVINYFFLDFINLRMVAAQWREFFYRISSKQHWERVDLESRAKCEHESLDLPPFSFKEYKQNLLIKEWISSIKYIALF